ncbi:hypothetical protein I7I50_01724 [Histoplasma capsulatum G186AR]|uniref:Uncharacterized protein n=1 Tax=Ajellomyces capsulatus TaxID=5037 RepID=A0A8H7YEF5_AJECA|nr:hypothetical protein I7I52_11938 [Histoplasma capsulatum]QSS71019.1 hypothetical protein I7I50_01724 [Histoplasma capsulatum G186AR]
MTISLAAVQRSTRIFNRSATTDKVCHLIHEAGERERMLFGSLKALSCAPIPGDNAPTGLRTSPPFTPGLFPRKRPGSRCWWLSTVQAACRDVNISVVVA